MGRRRAPGACSAAPLPLFRNYPASCEREGGVSLRPAAPAARLQLSYRPAPTWPAGAWLAHCRRGTPDVHVTHGSAVVTTPEWFGEIVWAGEFSEGAFDTTDIVFGSGGRLRADAGLTFVGSASTVDRLQTLRRGADVWVSNSLACLLAGTDTSVDVAYASYARDFRTVVRGLRGYRRSLPTNRERVELVYYDNLYWNGTRLSQRAKPRPHRDLGSFERYRAFLDGALSQLSRNMDAPGRTAPYRFLGTVSSGYDSATAAALARNHGLREVITFTEARGGEGDSGAPVAAALGLSLRAFARDAWQTTETGPSGLAPPEALFLASDGKGEDVYFRAAQPLLRGRVLV